MLRSLSILLLQQPTIAVASLRKMNAPIVQDEYIVTFHHGHSLAAHLEHMGDGYSGVNHVLRNWSSLPGYHVRLGPDSTTWLERMQEDPGVEFVEHNTLFVETSRETPVHEQISNDFMEGYNTMDKRWIVAEEPKAPYANAILTSPTKLTTLPVVDGAVRARYPPQAGREVDIYIMDTGIVTSHSAFEGRAANFQDKDTSSYCNGETMTDNIGRSKAAL